MTERRPRVGFEFPRELLLVEVLRRCRGCDEPARLGLTKAEARAYQGFECEHCESWNDDELTEQDIPEWWEELRVTGLDALRPPQSPPPGGADADGVIGRLSDEWRRGPRAVADEPDDGESGGEEV